MEIKSGENLVVGQRYRITQIDPHDPAPSLKVGDVVLCDHEKQNSIDPKNVLEDGMGCEWFADYDASEGCFCTLVLGVEIVP